MTMQKIWNISNLKSQIREIDLGLIEATWHCQFCNNISYMLPDLNVDVTENVEIKGIEQEISAHMSAYMLK